MSKQKSNRKTYAITAILIFIVSLITIVMTVLYNAPAKNDSNIEEKKEEVMNEDEFTEKEATTSNLLLAVIGDLMFHDDQLISAYDEEKDRYDFKPMFSDVKPILSDADVTLANFETTLGGEAIGFKGYPQFNSPDEVVDAIKDAGVDIVTTANNHILDTKKEGLFRTLEVLEEKGVKSVGTYINSDRSRILIHEEKDIKIAILAYTSVMNSSGREYPEDELHTMVNFLTEENINRDIKEAKEKKADLIIALVHWGVEYEREPSEEQIKYANLLAEKGVDLILGSHPHVIQPTDTIKTNEKDVFVIYSMGNFISNQRVETLGKDFAHTEDGIILLFDIEKDLTTKEAKVKAVDYIPTWVYKEENPETKKPEYRVLPIEPFLTSDEIKDSFKKRMENSYEATMSQIKTDE